MMDLRQMNPLKKKDVSEISHIFFIVKPKLELMSLIADNIHSLLVYHTFIVKVDFYNYFIIN
jgi:hypothetical protein